MKDKLDFETENHTLEFQLMINKSFGINPEFTFTTEWPSNGTKEIIAKFPAKNINLKNTAYHFNRSKKLIHFTSVQKLYSIINDCSLRMYNLYNCDDQNEYSFASTLLKAIYKTQGYNDKSIDEKIVNGRITSFITFCTSVENLKDKLLWSKYGHGNKGIAIEFEIINDIELWEYFFLSEIHYNTLNEFDTLILEWTNLQQRNRNIHYKIDFDQILSLHKSQKWSNEKEIRLLAIYPDLNFENFRELIFEDTKLNCPYNTKIKYLKLPLCGKKGIFINGLYNNRPEMFWINFPKIKLSDIHFGPEFESDIEFNKFQINLRSYIDKKINCWLPNLPKWRIMLMD